VDQDEDRQHHPVQRQEETLEEDQVEAVDCFTSLAPEQFNCIAFYTVNDAIAAE